MRRVGVRASRRGASYKRLQRLCKGETGPLPERDGVRHSLTEEQGNLCASPGGGHGFNELRSKTLTLMASRYDKSIDAPPRLGDLGLDEHRVIDPRKTDQVFRGTAGAERHCPAFPWSAPLTETLELNPTGFVMQSGHRWQLCSRERGELCDVGVGREGEPRSVRVVFHFENVTVPNEVLESATAAVDRPRLSLAGA